MGTKLHSLWLVAHRAIHKGDKEIISPITQHHYKVELHSNGCRYIILPDLDHDYVTVMEQNKNKIGSKYAERARNGETLSWVIPKDGSSWTLISEKVEIPKEETV